MVGIALIKFYFFAAFECYRNLSVTMGKDIILYGFIIIMIRSLGKLSTHVTH